MTINKILLELEETKYYPVSNEAIDYAINTIHKYQKIEKIIKNAGIFAFDIPEIRRIAEVMKDDKI